MPSNLVVKKFDGTTDVTYTAVTGASGTSPALYRSASVGSAVGHQPTLKLSSRASGNGGGNDRRTAFDYVYPALITSADTGATSILAKFAANGSFALPAVMPDADVKEAAYQLGNLLAHAILKEMYRTGYAPT